MDGPARSECELKRGEKEICDWLKVTPEVLRLLREDGLPHFRVGREVWCHTGAVNDWFYKKGMEK